MNATAAQPADHDQPTTSARGYLALGDSYTIGEGVAAAETWPWLLAEALAERIGEAAPVVVARTGWTAAELLSALADDNGRRAGAATPYGLVSLLIGVNDQYRDHHLDTHLAGFNRLLDLGIDFAGGDHRRLLVVSIPDWSVSAFAGNDARGRPAIAAAIDRYNAAQMQLCRERGIAHVDITGISRRCGADPAMFASDGLHPSGRQYAAWLAPILAAATALPGD
ncbi:MAG: GDSL-type esterase/lipase family protein [Xanthomonadales bacterium]|nr:GDSL-type esterase/lipase family protein [Xanthomonadales bacterium]